MCASAGPPLTIWIPRPVGGAGGGEVAQLTLTVTGSESSFSFAPSSSFEAETCAVFTTLGHAIVVAVTVIVTVALFPPVRLPTSHATACPFTAQVPDDPPFDHVAPLIVRPFARVSVI